MAAGQTDQYGNPIGDQHYDDGVPPGFGDNVTGPVVDGPLPVDPDINPETGLPWGQEPSDQPYQTNWQNGYSNTPYNPSNSPGGSGNTSRQGQTSWGGVSGVNPQAGDMDYDQINEFSDAAYENARRWMDPQLQRENERFQQELINKGIDPYSEQGRKAMQQLKASQNDMQSTQQFNAMKFGTDIQDQMFNQDLGRSELANALIGKDWDLTEMGRQFNDTLGQRGHEFDVTAGMKSNQMNFDQMMDLEGLDYRDYWTGVEQERYNDDLAFRFADMAPGSSGGTGNTNAMLDAMAAQYGEDSAEYRAALAYSQGL